MVQEKSVLQLRGSDTAVSWPEGECWATPALDQAKGMSYKNVSRTWVDLSIL